MWLPALLRAQPDKALIGVQSHGVLHTTCFKDVRHHSEPGTRGGPFQRMQV